MSSNNQTVVLVLATAAAAVALFLLLREDKKRRESFLGGPQLKDFELVTLKQADLGSGRYWRSPVNYIGQPWTNPHYFADKNDETLPLEMAEMAKGMQLIPSYVPDLTGSQYSEFPTATIPMLPDDLPTRMSNTANSNQYYTSWLGAAREDGTVGDYPNRFSISQAML